MTITYLIPAYLRPHAGGRTELSLDVEGATLADALAALWRAHLGLRDRVTEILGPDRFLQAPGQAAVLVECRTADTPPEPPMVKKLFLGDSYSCTLATWITCLSST